MATQDQINRIIQESERIVRENPQRFPTPTLNPVYDQTLQDIRSFISNPDSTTSGQYDPNQPTSEAQFSQWDQNNNDAQAALNAYQNPSSGYTSAVPNVLGYSNTNITPVSQPAGPPSNFTGFFQGTPYQGGTVQTRGGGFTPDGSYSAGYHGGGGGFFEDRGQWGTGMNMGPMVNGTVQTGGGGFTPDGSYSAGYHGSGEHPEITGESTPGQYKSGSFGPILAPDLSNGGKVGDFLRYIESMGYDTTGWNNPKGRAEIERQYNQNGGNFDGLSFLQTLPQANPNKTSLIAQYAGNKMMPTKDVFGLLGGSNFSNLFAPASYEQYAAMLNKQFGIGTSGQKPASEFKEKVTSLKDIPQSIGNQLLSKYINPTTGDYNDTNEFYKAIA